MNTARDLQRQGLRVGADAGAGSRRRPHVRTITGPHPEATSCLAEGSGGGRPAAWGRPTAHARHHRASMQRVSLKPTAADGEALGPDGQDPFGAPVPGRSPVASVMGGFLSGASGTDPQRRAPAFFPAAKAAPRAPRNPVPAVLRSAAACKAGAARRSPPARRPPSRPQGRGQEQRTRITIMATSAPSPRPTPALPATSPP